VGEPLILAVDDEAPILGIMRLTLETAGFRVVTAANGTDAIDLEERHKPDAILLDLMLPDIAGMEVLRQIRQRRDVPIMVVTADVTRGREYLPAPDIEYLVKPFEPDELVDTLRGLLATPGGQARSMLRAGELEIDPAKGVAARGGVIVPLTTAERTLLRLLAAHPGSPVSAEDLLVRTWGEDYRGDNDYLALWIARLRQKIEDEPDNPRLITGHSSAYQLNLAQD
jgi:two-component system response regulator MtrA